MTLGNDNPLLNWSVDRSLITYVGEDLRRPECVLAARDGSLWCSDARGGVMRISPDGRQTLVVPKGGEARGADLVAGETMPNGLAFAANGDVLVANFGTGALERITPGGECTTLYDSIDNVPLGKANFILRDSRGRLWFTVLTRLDPWTRSINEKPTDGYVGVIDDKGIRIVVEGLNGTNEIRWDAREDWLYIVESHARHITRVRFDENATVVARETFGPDDLGGTPDGCAFDACGNLWITLVMTDCLIALTPEGEKLVLLDDRDPHQSAIYNRHFYAGTMTPEVIEATRGTIAPWMASVTFGGPDLRTVYLGSLLGTRLASFRAPVAGLPLVHWNEH